MDRVGAFGIHRELRIGVHADDHQASAFGEHVQDLEVSGHFGIAIRRCRQGGLTVLEAGHATAAEGAGVHGRYRNGRTRHVQTAADAATALDQQCVQVEPGGDTELHDPQVQRGGVVHKRMDGVFATSGHGEDGVVIAVHEYQTRAFGKAVHHFVSGRDHNITGRGGADDRRTSGQANFRFVGSDRAGIGRAAGVGTQNADVEAGGQWHACVPVVNTHIVGGADGEPGGHQGLGTALSYHILAGNGVAGAAITRTQVDHHVIDVLGLHDDGVLLGGGHEAEPYIVTGITGEAVAHNGWQGRAGGGTARVHGDRHTVRRGDEGQCTAACGNVRCRCAAGSGGEGDLVGSSGTTTLQHRVIVYAGRQTGEQDAEVAVTTSEGVHIVVQVEYQVLQRTAHEKQVAGTRERRVGAAVGHGHILAFADAEGLPNRAAKAEFVRGVGVVTGHGNGHPRLQVHDGGVGTEVVGRCTAQHGHTRGRWSQGTCHGHGRGFPRQGDDLPLLGIGAQG